MTLEAKETRNTEAGHWYTRSGEPMYTVQGANGLQRNTTLRDARKLDLVPSVTTILNVAAKPALTTWLQQQVLLAALTLPRRPDEPEKDYLDRIINDSKEQGRSAADAGTDIHASIQNFYETGSDARHSLHIKAVHQALSDHFQRREWKCEDSFCHPLGFGGKVDLWTPAGIVVDIKTKEFYDPSKVVGYDEHLMQLAAYRMGLKMPAARCANIFVSRTKAGLVKIVEWSEDDLKRGWLMFQSLFNFWQLKNKVGEKDANS
jgi:hypothetical protein